MNILFGGRRLGKSHYLCEKLADDLAAGVDSVIVCGTSEERANDLKAILRSHGILDKRTLDRAVIGPNDVERQLRGRRAVVRIDDLDSLLFRAFGVNKVEEATFNVETPMKVFKGTAIEEITHQRRQRHWYDPPG